MRLLAVVLTGPAEEQRIIAVGTRRDAAEEPGWAWLEFGKGEPTSSKSCFTPMPKRKLEAAPITATLLGAASRSSTYSKLIAPRLFIDGGSNITVPEA